MNIHCLGGLTDLDSVIFKDEYSVDCIEPKIGSRVFPSNYQNFPFYRSGYKKRNGRINNLIPTSYQSVLNAAVESIDSNTSLCCIKLPNNILDALFKYFREWYLSSYSHLDSTDVACFAFLNYGYNKSLLPYLDLSDYNFESGPYYLINLANHNEIKVQDLSCFCYCNLNGINSKGINISNNDKRQHVMYTSIKNTDSHFDDGLILYTTFCNMEGLDLKGVILRPGMENGVSTFVNLKNTGATIDFSNSEDSWYINCNFDGCFIKGIHDLDLSYLQYLKASEFYNVVINYEGRIYKNQNEIQKLVDNLIKKAVTKQISSASTNQEKQKILKRN